jgi:predicted GNAT family acetyltransferase
LTGSGIPGHPCRTSFQPEKEAETVTHDPKPQEAFTIQRQEGETKGRYFVRIDEAEAEMTYSRLGKHTIIIDHTGVPKELGGRGIGQALVRRAVEDARAEGRKIIPLCPYAKAQIERHPEWQDVLKGKGGEDGAA